MAKYKAAVIGLGNIGLLYESEKNRPHPSTHVYAYEQSEFFEVICGIDYDNKKKHILKNICPKAFFFQTLEEGIESGVLDEADVISVATPQDTHYDIIKKLNEKKIGKIIFCEKPIVSNKMEIEFIRQLLQSKSQIIIPNISRRWNTKLCEISELIQNGKYGCAEAINIRYTRGIFNTGSHLFDLLLMWTGSRITYVSALKKIATSVEPENSFSFYFEMQNGCHGYAEAVDDRQYYLFEIDIFLSKAKIEMRYSGDEILIYETKSHHLFEGYKELNLIEKYNNILSESCMGNAVQNIYSVLCGNGRPRCCVEDAIYPLKVGEAIQRSYESGNKERVL